MLGSVLACRFEGESAGATALEHRDQSITYAELARAAQSIADKVTAAGVEKGRHIGILAETGTLVVPAMIGVMALGCVFVPLDPAHPPAHLREVADAADLACLLVEDGLAAPLAGIPTVPLDAGVYAAGPQSVATLLRQSTENALYIYFTSGTSGRPKPVLGRADSLLHFVRWEIDRLGLDGTVRVAQLTFPSHDPYLRDVFTPLVAGGTVCLPDRPQVVLSPVELGRWLDRTGVEVVHCTPTVFRNLCHGGRRAFDRLRYVVLAGEQLRGVHLAAWYEAFGDRIQLVNLYGPTETTLAKLCHFVSPDDVRRPAVPIGRPIDGARATVMAEPSRECGPGEIGELYIETEFGTLGYYRQPALTRAVFDPDPALADGGAVTYRTGDLVKRLPDGSIEFIGRRDRREKVRGKQVDLGRVEDEIVGRTDIESCVAAAAGDRLVAYYVAAGEIDEKLYGQRLARDLPKSMVPDVWLRVDTLPANANGKVDDAALAGLLAEWESQRKDDGSATDTESRLLELWRELLRHDAVGLDDPFLELGGDSLSIMLLIARLDEDHGYELSLWDVFDGLTIRKLAALIDGGTHGGL